MQASEIRYSESAPYSDWSATRRKAYLIISHDRNPTRLWRAPPCSANTHWPRPEGYAQESAYETCDGPISVHYEQDSTEVYYVVQADSDQLLDAETFAEVAHL